MKSDRPESNRIGASISVIIPAFNEELCLPATLQRVCRSGNAEIIVVDGGSADATKDVAEAYSVRVLEAQRGRAVQMNAGALPATGEILLFLHADTLLPDGWAESIRSCMNRDDRVGGAFALRIQGVSLGLRILEVLANFRSRCLGLPYGDQAIFVRAKVFRELGGFKNAPIMEDYEFMRRLRRRGVLCILSEAAITSGRRWAALGVWRTTVINQAVLLGYHLGVPLDRLARFYKQALL
jgi:uncharacterized protein